MSVYRDEEHMICVVGLCVSLSLPTARCGACRRDCGGWNHAHESENSTPGIKAEISCIPSPPKTRCRSVSRKACLLFCESSLLWQANHLHLSIPRRSQARTMRMPPHSVLTSAIDLFCLKLACVTIFPQTLSQTRTEMMSTWNNTQHVLVWQKKKKKALYLLVVVRNSLHLVPRGLWRGLLWEMKTGNIFQLP